MFPQAPIQNGRQQCATLAQKSDISRTRKIVRKCRIQPDRRIHHAKAIRTHQPHRTTAQLSLNQTLKLHAFRTTLLETSGNHNGRACAGIHALANYTRNGRRGSNNDGEIDGLGQCRHAGITLNSQQLGTLWIHGKHLAVIGTVNEILENCPAHASFTFRRTDHGNRRRREETFKS